MWCSISGMMLQHVATYRSKELFISDAEKKDLIKNVFVPDENFSFPKTNRNFKCE